MTDDTWNERGCSRRRALSAAGAALAGGLAGCLGGSDASPEAQVRNHREALSTYEDVARAVQDGYTMTTPYVQGDDGVLGVLFVNLDVPELEPTQPSVLFYDLATDGTFELRGVEWLVPTETTDSPPSMFGREFHGATPGETSFVPEHYGLHAWLFADDADLFAPARQNATPPAFVDDLATAWEALDPFYANEARAQEAGYAKAEQCVSTPDGGYGVPFVNTDYAGTDPAEPAVLLYRLSSSWTYRLIGAEWYVPESAGTTAELFGQSVHEPTAGHSDETDQPRHAGLHAWLYAANPDGIFAPYNPAIQC